MINNFILKKFYIKEGLNDSKMYQINEDRQHLWYKKTVYVLYTLMLFVYLT